MSKNILNKGVKVNFRENEIYLYALRVKDNDIPKGFKRYSIRHDDDDSGLPRTIENEVWVNHYGDILTQNDIKFDLVVVSKCLNPADYTELTESEQNLFMELI